MSRSAPAGRAVRVRVVAGALAGCGLLAACSGGATPPPVAADGALPVTLPGVMDDAIRVGFVVVDGGGVATAEDGNRADDSDAVVQADVVQAYVNFVNKLGGVGGREIVPTIVDYPAVSGSAEQAEDACTRFTVDSRVAAVVLDGLYEDDALRCYRDANTLMIDESLVAHDQQEFEDNAPYLWSPTQPEYSAWLRAQLSALRGEGYFDDVESVQVLAADTAVATRATKDIVKPFLESVGVEKTLVSVVDISNSVTLSTSTAAAIADGADGAFERVVTVGGGPTVAIGLADETSDYYRSTWAVSSFDAPAALAGNPARIVGDRLEGTSGLGFAPAYDLAPTATPFPDPARPAEAVCKGVLDAAGIVLGDGTRPDYRTAFRVCDATLFLKAALDRVPDHVPVTADAFAAAAGRIGSRYSSSLTLGSSYEPGQYAATNAGRVISYDASCACFTYKGDDVRISAN